jgi:hypothetical protein
MGWGDLPGHPFWAEALPKVAMPEQPLLDAFIQDNCTSSPHLEGNSRQVLISC